MADDLQRPDGPSGRRLAEAEALADPTRLRLLEEIEAAEEPLDVAYLTESARVHHTVVRQHLARLCDAGLVEERTAKPVGRGRPKLLYSPAPGPRRRSEQAAHYRRLALLLAEAIGKDLDPAEAGRRAGVAAAVEAVLGDEGGSVDALELLRRESERMGFEPEVDPRGDQQVDIVLTHCPFGDVAADEPETICALHAGIARGVAEATEELSFDGITVVDPVNAGCRLHLTVLDPTPVDLPRRRD